MIVSNAWILITSLTLGMPVAAQDASEIVKRYLENAGRGGFRASRDFTFLERRVQRELTGDGQARVTRNELYDVTILLDRPFWRLIERDGKPLAEKDAAKEQDKFDRELARRKAEVASQRGRRAEELKREEEKQWAFLRELPEAFDFRVAGEETVEQRKTWVLEAKPRPGYRPKEARARFFPKVKGRMWVDQQDYQMVRIEAEVIDAISFGLVLARLDKGATLSMRQTRVHDRWLPSELLIRFDARVALVKRLKGESQTTYSNYRRFETESRVLSAEAPTSSSAARASNER